MPRRWAARRGRRQPHTLRGARLAARRPGYGSSSHPLLVVVLVFLGCTSPPVQWVTGTIALEGASTGEYTLAVHGTPPQLTATAQPIPIPAASLPGLGTGACLNSVRWARAGAHEIAVAWWVARSDSSVVLRLAHSRDDGAHWDTLPPATVLDRGTRGCDRAPAAVALDPLHGYAHLAYWFEPASGAGVYYEQVTDLSGTDSAARVDRSSMFHAPVGIVYGEEVAETSVAGHGDTVAVAYQDPNGPERHIALALSVTAGRDFPERLEVSGNGIAASLPVVALDESLVAVGWTALAPVPGSAQPSATPAVGQRVVRLGVLP